MEMHDMLVEAIDLISNGKSPNGVLPMCAGAGAGACKKCPCGELFGTGDDGSCIFSNPDEAQLALCFGLALLEEKENG
jgi:hypothetical protein